MAKVKVDFSVHPAVAKCEKCGKEEKLPEQKKLSDTMKLIKEIEDKHKDCV